MIPSVVTYFFRKGRQEYIFSINMFLEKKILPVSGYFEGHLDRTECGNGIWTRILRWIWLPASLQNTQDHSQPLWLPEMLVLVSIILSTLSAQKDALEEVIVFPPPRKPTPVSPTKTSGPSHAPSPPYVIRWH